MINYNNLLTSDNTDDADGFPTVQWVPNTEFVDFDAEKGAFF